MGRPQLTDAKLSCSRGWLNRFMGRVKDYLEELHTRGFGETNDQSVCLRCIAEDGLRGQVAQHLTEDACTFCGREAEDDVPIAADFDELMRLGPEGCADEGNETDKSMLRLKKGSIEIVRVVASPAAL
jgi:hypothetical protein